MLTKIPYTFFRFGHYYFSKRVPSDLREHYSYHRIVQSLRTRNAAIARSRALSLAAKLDEHWAKIRIAHCDLPGKHLLKQQLPVSSAPFSAGTSLYQDSIRLKEALDTYVTVKGAGKGKTYHAAAERACGYLVNACGLKQLHEYSRSDALAYRDYLIGRGLAGSSVTRVFNALTAVFNFAVSEHGLDIKNPFTGVYHDRKAGVLKRQPIPLNVISQIQSTCKSKDDDNRWLIALISDTGLRLAEAAGLLVEDIKLEAIVPHLVIKPNSFRGLKTAGSERVVPMVGASLWAAKRVIEHSSNLSDPAFPRYNKTDETNANSASAALNKWLKPYVPERCTVHSFRHSMRDRLRAVECPTEMIDQIGGWTHDSVGKGYGNGYPLEQLSHYVSMVALE